MASGSPCAKRAPCWRSSARRSSPRPDRRIVHQWFRLVERERPVYLCTFHGSMHLHHSPAEALLEEVLFETGPVREIVLQNDDVNTFDHVIDVLMKMCGHDPIQAAECATIAHYTGKPTVNRVTAD